MMAFSDDFLNQVRDRNDIVDVVSSYVKLRQSGSNMFGLCPFHGEKTASFSVNRERQIYKCFGCGVGGGVINFVMEIEGLTFTEAVGQLAKRAGLEIPEQEGDGAEGKRRKRILELNKDAARYFVSVLRTPQGQRATEYMRERGITPAIATRFGLGCAPDSWDSLLNAMHEKGYSDYDLFDSGLVKKGQKGYYDAFRNRLMFPIIDTKGDVIGFSGRDLTVGESKAAKYYNSPESPVFNKGKNLFGMNLAKKSKAGYVILVEGNVDVVSLHQAGFDSTVASLGTSLTPEQARLISRYTNQVIIAYDSDAAGVKAAQKAISIFDRLDVKVRVLRMEGAKDPDEFIKLKGAESFRNLIEGSEAQMDYLLRQLAAKYNFEDTAQKLDFLKQSTLLVAKRPLQAEREIYSYKVAQLAGVSVDAVKKDIELARKSLIQKNSRAEQAELTKPVTAVEVRSRKTLKFDNPESAMAEKGIIAILYRDPSLAGLKGLVQGEDFTSPELRRIYEAIVSRAMSGSAINEATLSASLDNDDISLLTDIVENTVISLTNREQALRDYINKVKNIKNNSSESIEDIIRKKKQELGIEVENGQH